MTLQRSMLGQLIEAHLDLARVLLLIGAVIVAMIVLTAVFGWNGAAPSYQIVPDPAGALGLPF